MSGFNHYPSCGCGWCVSHGRTGVVVWDGHRSDAQVTLRQYGADRSRAACFIDHNARCPVCNARVFYYQNRHGSRVFFDDLAPLWTKHPCTDNRAPSGVSRLAFRSRGALAEISIALQAAGVPTQNDWWFGIVETTSQQPERFDVAVRFTQEPHPKRLTFRGSAVPIHEGDVVGLRKGEVSFFDLDAMEARIAAVGSEIAPVERQPAGNLSLIPWEAALLRQGDWESFLRCWQAPPYAAEMRVEEVCNFHAAAMDVAAFGRRMHPWVRAAWEAGRRSLASMADYLDANGIRTACGLGWNERRVYLLLKLMFSRPRARAPATPVDSGAGRRAAGPVPSGRHGDRQARRDPVQVRPERSAGLDLERLAALGRVTVRKPRP